MLVAGGTISAAVSSGGGDDDSDGGAGDGDFVEEFKSCTIYQDGNAANVRFDGPDAEDACDEFTRD